MKILLVALTTLFILVLASPAVYAGEDDPATIAEAKAWLAEDIFAHSLAAMYPEDYPQTGSVELNQLWADRFSRIYSLIFPIDYPQATKAEAILWLTEARQSHMRPNSETWEFNQTWIYRYSKILQLLDFLH